MLTQTTPRISTGQLMFRVEPPPFETARAEAKPTAPTAEAADLQAGPELAAILFTDIVGFSSIMARVPLGQIASRMEAYFQLLSECVQRHDGTVDKFNGDGMMALFPRPADAVRAGAAIQTAVDQFNLAQREQRLPLFKTRLAIDCGPVARVHFGAPPGRTPTVLGQAVNIAYHLAQQVLPGAVLISHQTYRLLPADFKIEVRGVYVLEWHEDQWVAVYEVRPV